MIYGCKLIWVLWRDCPVCSSKVKNTVASFTVLDSCGEGLKSDQQFSDSFLCNIGIKFKNLILSWGQPCFSTSLLCYFLRRNMVSDIISMLFSPLSFLVISQCLFQWKRSFQVIFMLCASTYVPPQWLFSRVVLPIGAYIDYNPTLIGRQLIITGYTGPGCIITQL